MAVVGVDGGRQRESRASQFLEELNEPQKSNPLPLVGTETLPLPCKNEQPRAELGNQEPKN